MIEIRYPVSFNSNKQVQGKDGALLCEMWKVVGGNGDIEELGKRLCNLLNNEKDWETRGSLKVGDVIKGKDGGGDILAVDFEEWKDTKSRLGAITVENSLLGVYKILPDIKLSKADERKLLVKARKHEILVKNLNEKYTKEMDYLK